MRHEAGAPGCLGGPAGPQSTVVQGTGTINTDPMAMAASAALSSNGVSSLQVGVRVDPTTVWEVSEYRQRTRPRSPTTGAGNPCPDFAGLRKGRSASGRVPSP